MVKLTDPTAQVSIIYIDELKFQDPDQPQASWHNMIQLNQTIYLEKLQAMLLKGPDPDLFEGKTGNIGFQAWIK